MDYTVTFLSDTYQGGSFAKVINPGQSESFTGVTGFSSDGTHMVAQDICSEGDTSTFQITSSAVNFAGNWVVHRLFIDGTSVFTKYSLISFPNITSDHTIFAEFAPTTRLNPLDCNLEDPQAGGLYNAINTTGWLETFGVMDGVTPMGIRSSFNTTEHGDGKFYLEFNFRPDGTPDNITAGLVGSDWDLSTNICDYSGTYSYRTDGTLVHDETNITSGILSSPSSNFALNMAVDFSTGKIQFGKNGTWFNSGNPVTGENPAFSGVDTSKNWYVGAQANGYAYMYINFNPSPIPDGFGCFPGPMIYQMSRTSPSHGSLLPSESRAVIHDQSIVFTAIPNSDYSVLYWTMDGTQIDYTDTTFVVDHVQTNHLITVAFGTGSACDVTTEVASGSGTISPSGIVKCQYGKNPVFTISPDSGYLIEKLEVDGTAIPADYTYVVTDFSNDHNLQVYFVTTTRLGVNDGSCFPAKKLIKGTVGLNAGATDQPRLIDTTDYESHYTISYVEP